MKSITIALCLLSVTLSLTTNSHSAFKLKPFSSTFNGNFTNYTGALVHGSPRDQFISLTEKAKDKYKDDVEATARFLK